LINGLEAGGETGELLNKIAVNIQENKIMQKNKIKKSQPKKAREIPKVSKELTLLF